MKKILITMILMGCIITAFSQQTDTSYMKYMKQDLIRRSTNNKKAGWILLGASGAMILGGIAGMFSSPENDDAYILYSGLTGFGVMGTLISIPFFIISGSQSIRAARISANVKLENHLQNVNPSAIKMNQLPKGFPIGQRQVPSFPSISLKLEIGR